jgi:hypothetical protein
MMGTVEPRDLFEAGLNEAAVALAAIYGGSMQANCFGEGVDAWTTRDIHRSRRRRAGRPTRAGGILDVTGGRAVRIDSSGDAFCRGTAFGVQNTAMTLAHRDRER